MSNTLLIITKGKGLSFVEENATMEPVCLCDLRSIHISVSIEHIREMMMSPFRNNMTAKQLSHKKFMARPHECLPVLKWKSCKGTDAKTATTERRCRAITTKRSKQKPGRTILEQLGIILTHSWGDEVARNILRIETHALVERNIIHQSTNTDFNS